MVVALTLGEVVEEAVVLTEPLLVETALPLRMALPLYELLAEPLALREGEVLALSLRVPTLVRESEVDAVKDARALIDA